MILEKPAILGGKPIFTEYMSIIKPVLNIFSDRMTEKFKEILSSNMLSGVNIYTKKLEDELKEFLDVNHVIAMSSCTSSMILTIQALGLRNEEIILPSFSFSATAHMLYWNNCKLKFVDVDRKTFNISPEEIRDAITPHTKAILGVHLYGNPCNIQELEKITQEYNLDLLFDGAHALGSKYKGKSIGGLGTATSYSASPTKLLSTIEGGFLSTNREELAEVLNVSRNYGNLPDYTCKLPGLNARLSEINAMVGLIQLESLTEFIKNRNKYASIYMKEISELPGLTFQKVNEKDLSPYKDFSIIIDKEKYGLNRNELAEVLSKENIQTKYYFYPPIHKLECYYKKSSENRLRNTEYLSENVLSLPIYNIMDESDIFKITGVIKKAYECRKEIRAKINKIY